MGERTHIAEIDEHKVKTGETLSSLAAANGTTPEQLGQFNFGTKDAAQINEHLHNDVGCTHKDASGNFIFDDSDDPGVVLIPKPVKLSGLMTDQLHTIRVREITPERNLHQCICVPGVTFEFDKSFIRPNVVEHLKKLDAALQKFPDAKLIVFGHTDRVGGEQYNKELSERRAQSAFAFVTDQADIWEQLFNQEQWGKPILNQILADLGFVPDPGPGDPHASAVKKYQSSKGLPTDGIAGPLTRKAMFTDYMTGKHDVHLTADQFFAPKFMGCGEFNPLVEPNDNELANGGRGRAPGNEPNRRVVFYLFKKPPRTIPCKLRNLGPCKTEIAKPGERENPLHKCAFYDGIAKECNCEQKIQEVRIRLFDWLGNALPDAPFEVTIGGQKRPRSNADQNGDIVLNDVVPGTCHIRWSRPDSMRKKDESQADGGSGQEESDFVSRDGSTVKVTLVKREEPEFEFEGEVFVNLPQVADESETGGMGSDGARKRLTNMGYSTADTLENNIRAFQRDCREEETGLLANAEGTLKQRHDEKCEPPGLSSGK